MSIKKEQESIHVIGKVVAIRGNSTFLVKCHNDKHIISRISAKFRSKKQKGVSSKIIEGSHLKIRLSLNDLKRGSIVSFASAESIARYNEIEGKNNFKDTKEKAEEEEID